MLPHCFGFPRAVIMKLGSLHFVRVTDVIFYGVTLKAAVRVGGSRKSVDVAVLPHAVGVLGSGSLTQCRWALPDGWHGTQRVVCWWMSKVGIKRGRVCGGKCGDGEK